MGPDPPPIARSGDDAPPDPAILTRRAFPFEHQRPPASAGTRWARAVPLEVGYRARYVGGDDQVTARLAAWMPFRLRRAHKAVGWERHPRSDQLVPCARNPAHSAARRRLAAFSSVDI